jgi:glycosyltransferase involved in cell wall biosynthesis
VKLSISIIHKYSPPRRDKLARCVASCLSQKLSGDGPEIILVVGGAEYELPVAWQSRVRLLVSAHTGVNQLRNLAAGSAQGDYLYFLDDDCELPEEGFLRRVLNLLENRPAVLGGPYLTKAGSDWKVEAYNRFSNLWGQIEEVNLLGGNVCYPREIFNAHAFEDRIVSGGDESEFHRRIIGAGVQFQFREELGVFHNAEDGCGSLLARAWRQGRAKAEWNLKRRAADWPTLKKVGLALARNPRLISFFGLHFMALFLGFSYQKFKSAQPQARVIENMRGQH